jgi:hypothetical protein
MSSIIGGRAVVVSSSFGLQASSFIMVNDSGLNVLTKVLNLYKNK